MSMERQEMLAALAALAAEAASANVGIAVVIWEPGDKPMAVFSTETNAVATCALLRAAAVQVEETELSCTEPAGHA